MWLTGGEMCQVRSTRCEQKNDALAASYRHQGSLLGNNGTLYCHTLLAPPQRGSGIGLVQQHQPLTSMRDFTHNFRCSVALTTEASRQTDVPSLLVVLLQSMLFLELVGHVRRV